MKVFMYGMPCWLFGPHSDGGADLAGGAVTALKAVVFDGGRPQRMQIIACRGPVDGSDGLGMMHHRKRPTGVDAASFDQHRARAALAVIATVLRAGQREVFTRSFRADSLQSFCLTRSSLIFARSTEARTRELRRLCSLLAGRTRGRDKLWHLGRT
jgi:hypothetical protein